MSKEQGREVGDGMKEGEEEVQEGRRGRGKEGGGGHRQGAEMRSGGSKGRGHQQVGETKAEGRQEAPQAELRPTDLGWALRAASSNSFFKRFFSSSGNFS